MIGPPVGVVILGSTGSIGTSTLDVIAAHPDRFTVVGLAAGSNARLLAKQVERFKPRYIACRDSAALPGVARVLAGPHALIELALLDAADIVVVATSGHVGIEPTLAALGAGKVVALANKEAIVAAGELVMAAHATGAGAIRPVDSEHSAIWQCLGAIGSHPPDVRRLILTASGGPFRGKTTADLRSVTPQQALRHPNWSMGPKVTVDSATLMNKGLELIEASWLFDMQPDQIDVIVHPQSIVHSLVEYADGSLIAQLGPHDMRLPIQYALTWPEHIPGLSSAIDLALLARLEFYSPDNATFPAIDICREAARLGSTYPTVLSAADDIAVEAFLEQRLAFVEIVPFVQRVLDAHAPSPGSLTLEAIFAADDWARSFAANLLRDRTSAAS